MARIPARIDEDPAFRGASWLVKALYTQLYTHRRIEAPAGKRVDILVFMLHGLSADPRADVEMALREMLACGLLLEVEGGLVPKHAPVSRETRVRRVAGVVNDNDDAAEQKRLAENRRVARHNWVKARLPPKESVSTEELLRLKTELERHYDEEVYKRKSSPLHPVTSPRSSADVTDVARRCSADVPVVTDLDEGQEGEKKSSFSFSSSPGKTTETPAENRAGATPSPDVTHHDVTHRNFVTSEPPAAPGLDLVEPLLRLAEERLGTADDAMWARLGARMVAFRVTPELAEVMGERASIRKLYLQDKFPRMPVGLLIGSRDGEGAILARWVDQTKDELREREQRAKDLAPGPSAARPFVPARTEPAPPARAVVVGGNRNERGVFIPPWKREPPRPK